LPGLVGRTPREVFEEFRTKISELLNKTVTDAPLAITSLARDETRAQLVFRRNNIPIAAPLIEKGLFLYIGQELKVEQQDKSWKLKTLQYRYRIQPTDDLKDTQALRWEYVAREVRDNEYCRHHFQAPIEFELREGMSPLSLKDAHLPTGWVTIEEIIRFLIVELRVKPKDEDGWDKLLRESEGRFKEWTGREI
jgi:hypothetical protein